MAVKRLTKRTVEGLRASQSDSFLWDEGLAGFGVKVTPTGRRVYIVQYRLPGVGRRLPARRFTLGEHGVLTVEEARRYARRVLNAVAEGRDPASERAEANRAPTVAAIAPLFLADVKAKRKATTYYEYARHFTTTGKRQDVKLRGELITHFGRLRVRDVTPAHIGAFHDRFRDRPYAGNRLLALLSAFFRWCERRGYRPANSNPCHGTERFKERKRERYLTLDELKRLGSALAKARRDGSTPAAVDALRFLSLSGFRESEALTLRWSAIDFDREAVTLEESKTGRSMRPLGSAAVAVLREIEREEGSDYVFPGQVPGSHLVELRKVWDRVRTDAGLTDVRLHDLRHSVASIAASGGASLPLIGALLGHRDVKSTQRYAHLTDDARKLVADKTAREISDALGGQGTPVTPLRGARR
ncbi:MAG: site-specific integrase [Gemmatimonadetes bacterium]|nr:site-specific integrase [Gemmatimonadota bacterium]